MLARACAVARVALLVLLLHQASAAFYSKGSDVVAISDAAGLKRLQRSNYLWVLEFYREGCGYCVQAAPEYEKVRGLGFRIEMLRLFCGYACMTMDTRLRHLSSEWSGSRLLMWRRTRALPDS